MTRHPRSRRLDARICTVLIAAAMAGPLSAQQPAPQANDRLEYMTRSVADYQMTAPGPRGESLEVRRIEQPLLRWDNPVSNVPDGTLFLWTDRQARPVAIVQVFIAAGTDDLWLHEFQSLLDGPFELRRTDQSVWKPGRAGIAWRPLPDSPAPVDSKAGRLTQMRQLAKRFSAEDDFEGKSRWELRLMPTPLHRYGGADNDSTILDGGLFAYAHGTDPEALLMLEARTSKSGPAWFYALAPMTGYALRIKDRGTEVWAIDARKPPFQREEPFFITKYFP